MAEMLVFAVNRTHPNPVKDRRGCYKRGDIVVVKPNGWGWGTEETKAPKDGGVFVIIKIPGVSVASIEKYTASDSIQDGFEPNGQSPNIIHRTRRLFRAVIDELPSNVVTQLRDTGVFTTTSAAIKPFIENKLSLLREG